MKSVLKLLAALLKVFGRKDIRIFRSGTIMFERHYLLWKSRGIFSKFPNVVLHHFPYEVPDEEMHDHGRPCWSLILTGGYVDLRESGPVVRRAWSLRKLEYDEKHRIIDVLPDTWSLFFSGWVVREWIAIVNGAPVTKSESFSKDKAGIAGLHRETPKLLEACAARRIAVARLKSRRK